MDQDNAAPELKARPLTQWKNSPKLSDLKQDFQDAKPIHDAHVAQVQEWLDNHHVRGKAKPKAGDNRSAVQPKLIRKQAEWRYPALTDPFLSTEDLFNVRPVTWEDRAAAQQNELVLNYQFNTHVNKVSFIDEYVRTCVDEGSVIVRTGWEYEEEEYEDDFPVFEFQVNPMMAEQHQMLAQMQAENPAQFLAEVPEELRQAHQASMEMGQPLEPVLTGYRREKRIRVLQNRPTVEVCETRNVIIDPSCRGDMRKARFVIHSFESSLAELKKDGKYKNLDRINLEGSSPLGDPDHESTIGVSGFNFSDNPRKRIVVYEYWGYWDIDGSGLLTPIVAAWVGDTMIRLEVSPYSDKQLPFVVVPYMPIRKSVYGEPDGELLEDNQKIIGAVTRGMIDIMGKSANGQTGIRRDMLDVTNRRRFDRGQDYEFNANVDPRQGIYMHTYPEIPNSAQFMLQLQNMEAESLTGVKSFSMGVSGQSLGDVAAGIRGALDAASKRELSILRRLSDGIIQIGRKFISMNAEFFSEEEVIRITNEQFVPIRRDDLQGNFDLKLSISTAEEDNNKAQELAFMLQTMGNNMDPEMSKMILSDIARLRKMPDLAKKIESYQPQPDPLMQRKMELEVQLLEAQLMNEQAQAQERQANAQLMMAKIGTEEVKQGNVQSDTDLKNLDFVEQESGVKQERDLQKQGEQARSQAQLKLLDRQFDLEKERIKSNSETN